MIKILLADDHTVVREALAEMLNSRDLYQISGQAGNGEELIQLLRNTRPDIILMDLAMPEMDGLEALCKINNQFTSPPPVLILSATNDEKNVRKVLCNGAAGYIPKNSGIDELEFAIKSILAGKKYLSPSMVHCLLEDSSETADNNPFTVLTKRELEIVTHLADGETHHQIAKTLHISTRTVDTHRSNIMKKLEIKTNAELVKLAIIHKIITL